MLFHACKKGMCMDQDLHYHLHNDQDCATSQENGDCEKYEHVRRICKRTCGVCGTYHCVVLRLYAFKLPFNIDVLNKRYTCVNQIVSFCRCCVYVSYRLPWYHALYKW